MKFDHDILFDFLPVEDKKSFMVWDSAFLSGTLTTQLVINATYRAQFEERIRIPFEEYQIKLKQKERDKKLKQIL
jgi:hypothetical protein